MTLVDSATRAKKPRWSLAEREANRLTADYTSPPIPVLEIAQRNGVEVIFTKFTKFTDVVSGFCDFASKKIFVNANDAPTRQRFTMAHELGHWILHREYYEANPGEYPVLPRFSDPDSSDPLEKEANTFAAHLLVPTRLLIPVQGAFVSRLAEVFIVSVTMMEYRLRNVREKNYR